MRHRTPVEQLKTLKPDLDISKELARTESPSEKVLGFFLRIVILCLFGWVIYFFYAPLFFGVATVLLPVAALVGINYLLFSRFPRWLGGRTHQPESVARRTVELYLLFGVAVALGSYTLPNLINPKLGWYWRVCLGISVGVLAVITRRFP